MQSEEGRSHIGIVEAREEEERREETYVQSRVDIAQGSLQGNVSVVAFLLNSVRLVKLPQDTKGRQENP